jgi:hypothetical protein
VAGDRSASHSRNEPLMIRVISIALAFVALTLVLLRSADRHGLRPAAKDYSASYHRILCALIGARIREGRE